MKLISFITSTLSVLVSLTVFAGPIDQTIAKSDAYLEEVSTKHLEKENKYIDEAIVKATTRQGRLLEKIDQLNIRLNAGTTLDILDGLGLGLSYRYGVGPAYIGDYFVRQDSYGLRAEVRPFEWFMDDVKPWVFEIEPGTEITFWQMLPNAKEARKVRNGYSPARFPLSAEKALRNLKPGDMAHLRAYLNLNVGAKEEWDIAANFEVRGKLIYTISGYFDVFVFRADENKVRLRIIGRRNRGTDGRVEFGVNDDFQIFGWEVGDDAIVNWADLDRLVMKRLAYGKQNIFLGDYTLNLDHPEVRDAYDEVFSKALKFKGINFRQHPAYSLWNPRKNKDEVREEFVSNLTRLDDIYREDLEQKDHDRRRVDRNFAGTNQTNPTLLSETHIGITGIYRVKDYVVRRDNGLSLLNMQPDGTEKTDHYFYPSWNSKHDVRGLISLFREQTFRSATMIYEANRNYEPVAYKTTGFFYDYTDKLYENNEHQSVLHHFKRVLPSSVYADLIQELAKKGFDQFKNDIKNVRVSARYFLNGHGLRTVEHLYGHLDVTARIGMMRDSIIKHLEKIPPPSRNPANFSTGNPKTNRRTFKVQCRPLYKKLPNTIRDYCEDVEVIAPLLAKIVEPNIPATLRHEAMDQLSDNHLFRQIGPGLMFRLIPEVDLAEATYFEVKFYLPKQVEPLTYNYPRDRLNPDRELFETILDLQNLMDNLTPDMRINGNVDNLTTRKVEAGRL